jgi:hypothetical protein
LVLRPLVMVQHSTNATEFTLKPEYLHDKR